MDKYTTTQGDTFDIIAFKLFGREGLMHELADANPAYQDTVFFSAGVVLEVPEIEKPYDKGPVPPWQR